jgi:hypothetical protein
LRLASAFFDLAKATDRKRRWTFYLLKDKREVKERLGFFVRCLLLRGERTGGLDEGVGLLAGELSCLLVYASGWTGVGWER